MDMTNALRHRSTLVYDGQCSFCRRWVARIARRDRSGTFEFVARQTDGLVERFPKLDEGDFNTGMRLITPDGAVHVGADAAYQIARRLRYWRWIAWLYHVPGIHSLTRTVYAWIAANRQSLGGDCDDGTYKPD
jgi:predicted DCC family thiol-disulfide oxidoreductase YuxK